MMYGFAFGEDADATITITSTFETGGLTNEFFLFSIFSITPSLPSITSTSTTSPTHGVIPCFFNIPRALQQ